MWFNGFLSGPWFGEVNVLLLFLIQFIFMMSNNKLGLAIFIVLLLVLTLEYDLLVLIVKRVGLDVLVV